MTRKLGQVQRKQIKVDPDVHEEKARVEREIMLDLAQLALHFETQILELGSLRQYHWKINVSTENFGCWQRVNWPWPDKSLREWACKLWTRSGKKWTFLETTKKSTLLTSPLSSNDKQKSVTTKSWRHLFQTLPLPPNKNKQKPNLREKSWPHLLQGRLKLPDMLVLCLLLTLLLVQHLQVKIWITKWLCTSRLYLNLNFSLLHLLPQAVPLCFHALWNFKWCSFTF